MHAARNLPRTKSPVSGDWNKNGPGKMSEKSSQPVSEEPAGAKLINQYKPVGIAALNAAALCKNAGAPKKKKQVIYRECAD